GSGPRPRLFALEDDGAVLGVAVLLPNNCLLLTWMTQGMLKVLVEGLARLGCEITNVYAPAHVSWRFARDWAERNNQPWRMGAEERVYQLARLREPGEVKGHLEMADAQHRGLLMTWMEAFIRETDHVDTRTEVLVGALIAQRR